MGLVRSALSAATGGRDRQEQRQLEYALREEIARLARRIDGLEARLRELEPGSNGRFHADMTLAEVRETDARADTVLARHHLGGCASCAVSTVETLRQGTDLHQIDLDALLADLNALA